MASNYGRSHGKLGKVHIIDPETYNRTYVGGLALCCGSSCVRMLKAESPGAMTSIDCKSCLKMYEKRNAAKAK